MTLKHTESWMALPRYTGDDADNATNNAARDLAMRSIMGYGYEYFRQAPNAGWVVRQHPVFPERNALVFSCPGSQNYQYQVRRPLGKSGDTIIGGFSLFIPGVFKNTPYQGNGFQYPFLMISVAAASASITNMVGNDSPVVNEMFRVSYDMRIRWGTENQSTRVVTPGKLAYFEYQITPTDFRVWLDDILVLQKDVVLNPQTISIGTVSWTPNPGYSPMAGAEGRWAIADIYSLVVDGVAPTMRLGPSTRVIGTKPDSDNSVQFLRPSGFASNAAVVAQAFDPEASSFLKTDTIGAKDLYNPAADSETSTASMVHAVNVKVVAQNIEATPHVIQPIVSSGGNDQGTSSTMSNSLAVSNHISTVDPATGQPWTPSAAAGVTFGVKLVS